MATFFTQFGSLKLILQLAVHIYLVENFILHYTNLCPLDDREQCM